jgi:hypothetical protein
MKPLLRASLILLVVVAHGGCMVPRSPGVTGRVTDARTGRAVAGAHVGFAQFSTPAATTDARGQFHLPVQRQFSPLPMFTFEFVHVTLQVAHPRYRNFTTEIDRAVEDFHCDIHLQPSQ